MAKRGRPGGLQQRRILEALADGRVARLADLRKLGIQWKALEGMVQDGMVEQVGRGTYRLSGSGDTTWQSFAALSVRHPSAVICLVSAAMFHGLTQANAHKITAAFPYDASIPTAQHPPVRGFRWKGASLEVGVEEHKVAGAVVRITSPARTVVDLFRTRNRTGEVELAMEVLRSYLDRGGTVSELYAMAKSLRQRAAIEPYIEAMQELRS